MLTLELFLWGFLCLVLVQAVPFQPESYGLDDTHSGTTTLIRSKSDAFDYPEPPLSSRLSNISSTTIESLDSYSLRKITTLLHPKEAFVLTSASKNLRGHALPDIRVLYAQRFQIAHLVSPVSWYLFCVEFHTELIPQHFDTLSDCLTEVDGHVQRNELLSYRLQFLYRLVATKANYPQMSQLHQIALNVMDRKPAFSEIQLSSFLYFVTEQTTRDNQTLGLHEALFIKICLGQEANPSHLWNLYNACQVSVGLLTDQAYKQRLLTVTHYDPERIKDQTAHMLDLSGKSCSNTIPVFGRYRVNPSSVRSIKDYVQHGAYINHECQTKFLKHDSLPGPIIKDMLVQKLRLGFAIDHPDDELSMLYYNADVSVVRTILEYGASVNVARQDGKTPLYYACKRNQQEKARVLLDYGADPNFGKKSLLTVSEDVGIISLLLERGAKVNYEDREGNTPIFHAVSQFGNLKMVKLLVDHGADFLHVNRRNQTLLMLGRDPKVTQYLLSLPGAVALLDAQDKGGKTALAYSVKYLKSDIISMLIEAGANVDITDKDGQTVLMSDQMSVEDAHQLLGPGRANPNIQEPKHGYTALMFAVAYKKGDLVKVLLEYGARVGVIGMNGTSALSIAQQTLVTPLSRPKLVQMTNVLKEALLQEESRL